MFRRRDYFLASWLGVTGKDVTSSDVTIRRMEYMLMYGCTYSMLVCTRVDCYVAFQRVPFIVFVRKVFVKI